MTELEIWVVTANPKDYPGCFVARKWVGKRPSDEFIVTAKLNPLRRQLEERGLVKLMRMEGDDPVIVETWL